MWIIWWVAHWTLILGGEEGAGTSNLPTPILVPMVSIKSFQSTGPQKPV
jgi:hypothetical protein